MIGFCNWQDCQKYLSHQKIKITTLHCDVTPWHPVISYATKCHGKVNLHKPNHQKWLSTWQPWPFTYDIDLPTNSSYHPHTKFQACISNGSRVPLCKHYLTSLRISESQMGSSWVTVREYHDYMLSSCYSRVVAYVVRGVMHCPTVRKCTDL